MIKINNIKQDQNGFSLDPNKDNSIFLNAIKGCQEEVNHLAEAQQVQEGIPLCWKEQRVKNGKLLREEY